MLKKISIFFRLYGLDYPDINAKLMYYSQMYFRKLDDITDGDEKLIEGVPLKEEKKYILEFLEERESAIETDITKDDLDIIMHEMLDLSSKTGINYKDEFHTLFASLKYDIKRRTDIANGEIYIPKKRDLDKYFFNGYADSCARCLVKVTGSPNYDINKLHNLMYANRIYYDLIDFLEDLSFGLLNISKEDMYKFGICEKDIINLANDKELIDICKNEEFPVLRNIISPEIYNWLLSELVRGLYNLGEWYNASSINTVGDALTDLFIKHENPTDTLLYFAYGVGTDTYFKKLVKKEFR